MKKKYHFTGIGGVGMAGVAFLLKKAGHDISGCDLCRTPRTQWLENNGIPVEAGHSPSHITPDLDVCVFTPAVQKDSPEYLAAAKSACHVQYRGEALAEIFNLTDGIAVCGTHGKTTTSTFIVKLLAALGESPSWCIGGETGDFPVAGTGRDGGAFIVEADESDGTLALYKAKTLVVTSLDYDHPDHFKTYDDYLECYREAMTVAGAIVKSFELPLDDWPEIRPLVLGEHNVRNARTAVEVALLRGHSREAILAALPEALNTLPDRRFERIWPPGREMSIPDGLRQPAIFSDYAHHPAEMTCAISMARSLHPKRLRVIFQPHRYSRTKALLEEFPPALAEADEVVLVPVYPAFEEPIPGGDIADLYVAIRNHFTGKGRLSAPPILARNALEAWKHVFLTSRPGDLVMLLGAGDIIGLVPRILRDMASWECHPSDQIRPSVKLSEYSFFGTGGITFGRILHAVPQHGDAMILGAGSNTWISDCATDADIVKAPPESSASELGSTLVAKYPALSFMAGIPGTVGGWAKMNAGAFGDCIGNHIDHVISGGRKIPASECGFAYRTSSIPGLITHVALKDETHGDGNASAGEYLARRKKFPPRTCGSVFKNPSPEIPAGKLLEEADAKELKVGGAYVWEGHANVIAAGEGCTSSDILALARLMAARVRERTGIVLQPEIRGLEV